MKLIYVGDLFPLIANNKKVIEKYQKGIKKENFIKNLLAVILMTLMVNILTIKITFALAD